MELLKLSSDVNECKPLVLGNVLMAFGDSRMFDVFVAAGILLGAGGSGQGLTLVHFSSQRKRFRWDRECLQGMFRGFYRGIGGYEGGGGVHFVSKTAQVELKSGRV